MYSVAIDVGGTFTDCLVWDGNGQLSQFKAPTTPDDPSKGLLNCLAKAARSAAKDPCDFIGAVDSIIHGTTLATNALLTERGVYYYSFTNRNDGWENRVELTKKLTETLSTATRHETSRGSPDGKAQNYTRLKLLFGLDF